MSATTDQQVDQGADEHATGVVGNARLTAVTGIVLTALLLVEGVTVLDVRGMLTLHMYLGLLLIPPVLLKCASTVYRFGSYYRGRPAYVERGAPHIVLRALGPLVVLSTLAVLGTGVWLLALGKRDDTVLTLHQGSFVVWIAVTSVHFLGHLRGALVDGWHEIRPPGGDRAARRRGLRLALVVLSLVAGVGVATAFMPSSLTAWQHHDFGYHDGHFDH